MCAKKGVQQPLLLTETAPLPEALPRRAELRPARNLAAVFADCHNYVYANEGLLKDKIFHEVVKLLVMKLHDEQATTGDRLKFGITAREHEALRADTAGAFVRRLAKLFDTVSREYQGLFSDQALRLQPLTLAYVVSRLQFISLTDTPGDVKGEAFQTFVYRHQRGDRGEFFTPYPVVTLAVEMIAPGRGERIIDPACGSGGFLIQAIAYARREHHGLDGRAYIRDCVRGIEFNPDVAFSATVRLAFEGGSGREVECANALADNREAEGSFDVVLTNPPFGSKGKIEDRRILKHYALARRWHKTAAGDWAAGDEVLTGQSPEILFIEKCMRLLRPGGRLAIVLPDGLLQNVSSGHVRQWLRAQAKVLSVVSIPQEAFVPYGTGIKTSLLLVQKRPARAGPCFMARLEKVGYDVKGQPIYRRDEFGQLLKTPTGAAEVEQDVDEIAAAYRSFKAGAGRGASAQTFTVPDELMNSRLDVEHYQPADRELIAHLEACAARPLGVLADILREADDFRLAADSLVRYIAIGDVDARTMQVVSQQVIRAHEAPARATFRLREHDIITAVSGASTGTSRQATALITADEAGAICSNGFAVLRNIHGVEPLYLLAYMRTELYLRQIRRLMTGHAIPAISQDDLSKVLVPIPPRAEQQKIAQAVASVQRMRREAMKAGAAVIEQTEQTIGNALRLTTAQT